MTNNDLPFPELEENNNNGVAIFSKSITKSEIESKANLAVMAVEEGNVDAIDMFTKARALRDVCDSVIDKLKDSVVSKVTAIHKDDRKFNGVEIQLTEGSTKYNYSHSLVWQQLKDKADDCAKKLKDYEKLMVVAMSQDIYDNEGILVDPAVVSGGTTPVLKVVIPK